MEIKYHYVDKTLKENRCAIGTCPAIYEGFKEITPSSDYCGLATCPAVYSSKDKDNVYLIIGKLLPKENLSEVGLGDLEKKIGEDEVLIEIPKTLIDNLDVKKK